MSETGPVAGANSGMDIPARDVPLSASPDPAFSRIMNEAMNAVEPAETPLLPATKLYNSHNLLNGQFPPPDSGAGYTFTTVSLRNDEAA